MHARLCNDYSGNTAACVNVCDYSGQTIVNFGVQRATAGHVIRMGPRRSHNRVQHARNKQRRLVRGRSGQDVARKRTRHERLGVCDRIPDMHKHIELSCAQTRFVIAKSEAS